MDSYGLLAMPVEAALRLCLDDRLEKGDDWGGWGERQQAVREAVAGLLNADADEIAVTTSASAGINSLASGLDFSDPRDRVLVSNLEFPTGSQIWHAQTSRGAVVEYAPEAADGTVPLEHFDRLIDDHRRWIPAAGQTRTPSGEP